MLFHPRSRNRPFHWGPLALEALPRDAAISVEMKRVSGKPDATSRASPLETSIAAYQAHLGKFASGEPAPATAPLPDDLQRRAADIKGAAYFMDASACGICRLSSADNDHRLAIVIAVEAPRLPEADNIARGWIQPAAASIAGLRAAEIAIAVAGHIRAMGFAAVARLEGATDLDLEGLAVLAGLAVRKDDRLFNPFITRDLALAAVSTDYDLPVDLPLAAGALKVNRLADWFGINGARSARERRRRDRRPTHLSLYPMETVRRVERPTTLILDDEVPRVPKRAAFFQRALHGDLGDKAKAERSRFAFKTPFSWSLLHMIRALVPHQDGTVAPQVDPALHDAAANTKAIKSLSYALGSDLTGICEIPPYAWFSHREDGSPIAPYHRYAVVMLIDQGFDTMEGASGDDWVSGAQSMRSYLRGAEIAGVMADFLRGKGIAARAQTNADSDVLHIPLILWAGLGELSRIGELVLNPFVGPRFKSVVLTTDLPLMADKPIDFGLQIFCGQCRKCARECPCDAISLGPKIMFNGYEMWKPDVERCTRYRLTNQRGSACGRCMKTCPLNKVVDADGALLIRLASWCGVNAMWLKPLLVPVAAWLDDVVGHGRRNLAKKWWFDHEIVAGRVVEPRATNQRDIDPGKSVDAARQKMAYYTADMMPPPDEPGPVPLDRKAAMQRAGDMETPQDARQRKKSKGATLIHYRPTPPRGIAPPADGVGNPYK